MPRLLPERVEDEDRAPVTTALELGDELEDDRMSSGADVPRWHHPRKRERAATGARVGLDDDGLPRIRLAHKLVRPVRAHHNVLVGEEGVGGQLERRELRSPFERKAPPNPGGTRPAREPRIAPIIRSVWWRTDTLSADASRMPWTPWARSHTRSAAVRPRIARSVSAGRADSRWPSTSRSPRYSSKYRRAKEIGR